MLVLSARTVIALYVFSLLLNLTKWNKIDYKNKTQTIRWFDMWDFNHSPRWNFNLSPRWDFNINPWWNFNLSPRWNFNLSPRWNFNLSPRWNFNLSPRWNFNLSPRWNFNLSPSYATYCLLTKKASATVKEVP